MSVVRSYCMSSRLTTKGRHFQFAGRNDFSLALSLFPQHMSEPRSQKKKRPKC